MLSVLQYALMALVQVTLGAALVHKWKFDYPELPFGEFAQNAPALVTGMFGVPLLFGAVYLWMRYGSQEVLPKLRELFVVLAQSVQAVIASCVILAAVTLWLVVRLATSGPVEIKLSSALSARAYIDCSDTSAPATTCAPAREVKERVVLRVGRGGIDTVWDLGEEKIFRRISESTLIEPTVSIAAPSGSTKLAILLWQLQSKARSSNFGEVIKAVANDLGTIARDSDPVVECIEINHTYSDAALTAWRKAHPELSVVSVSGTFDDGLINIDINRESSSFRIRLDNPADGDEPGGSSQTDVQAEPDLNSGSKQRRDEAAEGSLIGLFLDISLRHRTSLNFVLGSHGGPVANSPEVIGAKISTLVALERLGSGEVEEALAWLDGAARWQPASDMRTYDEDLRDALRIIAISRLGHPARSPISPWLDLLASYRKDRRRPVLVGKAAEESLAVLVRAASFIGWSRATARVQPLFNQASGESPSVRLGAMPAAFRKALREELGSSEPQAVEYMVDNYHLILADNLRGVSVHFGTQEAMEQYTENMSNIAQMASEMAAKIRKERMFRCGKSFSVGGTRSSPVVIFPRDIAVRILDNVISCPASICEYPEWVGDLARALRGMPGCN
ncbi:hypothetical protein [Sorangium sp. So ce1099]|uniref:hypothetical protein n=1 Tax=Sorangium sp. So ce1099 TaxID=3133331 RepID=UPI003F60500E